MPRSVRHAWAAVAIVAGLACSSAYADYTVYYRPAKFADAIPDPLTLYGFSLTDTLDPPQTYTQGPIVFGSPDPFTSIGVYEGLYGPDQTYLYCLGAPEDFHLTIAPATGALYAIGLRVGSNLGNDDIFISVNGGAYANYFQTPHTGYATFVGISSADPITQISLRGSNTTEIDVLDFWVPAAVPEPSSGALATAGLAVLAARKRKKRRTNV